RKRGRPRTTWRGEIHRLMNDRGLEEDEWQTIKRLDLEKSSKYNFQAAFIAYVKIYFKRNVFRALSTALADGCRRRFLPVCKDMLEKNVDRSFKITSAALLLLMKIENSSRESVSSGPEALGVICKHSTTGFTVL
ncbi:hypothetical protein L9F63_013968, partial [Diploptera punctata]